MRPIPALPLLVLLITARPLSGQQDFSGGEIAIQEVAPGLYMLTGSGGNIGVSVGPDGVFLIDDQDAPLTDRIVAAIARITPEPARFVLDTHWVADQGSENLGRAGDLIVAHDGVRERMSVEQALRLVGQPISTAPASPPLALPVLTFAGDVTFHLNGEEIHAFHVENAHTEGDVLIHFRGAKVIQMGDTFFRDRFPLIDTATGGSIDGMIAAAGAALALIDPDTKVMPGDGALSSRADLEAYRDALQTMRDEIADLYYEGHPLEHILEFRPLEAQARAWGQDETAERTFVEAIYHGLTTP